MPAFSNWLANTTIAVTGTNAANSTEILSSSISKGTWDIQYFITMNAGGGTAALFDSFGNLVPNSEISGHGETSKTTATGRVIVTNPGPGGLVMKLKGWNTTPYQVVSNGTDGRTGIVITEVLASIAGPVGPAGPAGARGAIGATGVKGNNGLNGTNGTNGLRGSQGIQGLAGPAGAVGPAGVAGVQGPQGPGRPVTINTRAPTSADGNVGDVWYQIS